MMRAVRFTKAEVYFLRQVLGKDSGKFAPTILAKLDRAEAPAESVAPAPIEAALVEAARGKVVPLGSGAGYGRASRQATAVGATPEDARLVGAWMARQAWLHGPQTLLDVLNKWPQWLAKARATAPPDHLQEGLGVVSGKETRVHARVEGSEPGQGGGVRRPPPGFR